ncbi:MAG: DUF5666 domain-containing protein [Acidobacteriota bacterium]
MALLLFGALVSAGPLEPQASADGIALNAPSPVRASSIEGTVSAVTGPILDLIEGGIQIDVTHATITGGDDRLANPLPWSGIPVGARVVAQVTVPDLVVAVFPPPPLPATNVVVFQTRAGALSGTIQSVDVRAGKFLMLDHSIATNAGTKWSGGGPNGAVKGIGDLAAGMSASVEVVNSGGLLATSVEAHGTGAPPELIAFRGPVQTISATAWTIAGRGVQIDSDTKIAGDPKVGDTVDVVARVHNPPPGSLAPSYLVAVSIVKSIVIVPPGPGDRATEFDGAVESIPPTAAPGAVPPGHWKIASRDVVVNGLTRVDSGIVVGTTVHVKGVFMFASGMGGSLFSTQFVATEIRKK